MEESFLNKSIIRWQESAVLLAKSLKQDKLQSKQEFMMN
jgi:hypothetical protein